MIEQIKNVFLTTTFGEIAVIILVAFIAIMFVRRVLNTIDKLPFVNDWLKSLTDTARLPARGVIFGYALFSIAEVLIRSNEAFHERLLQARYVFVIGVVAWLLFRWKSRIEELLIKRVIRKDSAKSDKALFYALSKLASIILAMIITFILLDVFGVPLQAFLALGGVSSVAVGWAAKDVVANFFGGFMIYVNRPFMIGDWIKSPNKHFEGTVEAIGWYMTQIRTFERRPLYIPNALITDAIIENPGRMYNRRIKETIGVRYADINKVDALSDAIKEMLQQHPGIDQNQTLMVHFIHFGAYSLELEVYTFTKTTVWNEYREIQQDIFLRIVEIIESHGAQIAFPTQTVKLENMAK